MFQLLHEVGARGERASVHANAGWWRGRACPESAASPGPWPRANVSCACVLRWALCADARRACVLAARFALAFRVCADNNDGARDEGQG